jgi:hypothetical protein
MLDAVVLMFPAVLQFIYEERYGNDWTQTCYLMLGFSAAGEPKVGLRINSWDAQGYRRSQWSGWHGCWEVIPGGWRCRLHWAGDEQKARWHTLRGATPQHFFLDKFTTVFCDGMKTKNISTKMLGNELPQSTGGQL